MKLLAAIKACMAKDGFRSAYGTWGGELVDLQGPFAMRDKVMHALAGAVLAAMVGNFLALGFVATHGIVLMAGVGIELVELWRYKRYGWTRSMSDLFSWRDLVANHVGAVVGYFLL
jgi:hypothetical protein